MIDLRELKERREEILANIKARNMEIDLDAIIALQDRRSALLQQTETLRARRNENAKMMKGKLEAEQRTRLIEEGKSLKEEISTLEGELNQVEEEYLRLGRTIPNYAHPDAPLGVDESDYAVLHHRGTVPEFSFTPLDHVELGERLDLIDFDSATKVSGPKFYYLKREAVILHMALERYAMDIAMKRGFTPFITPDIAKEEILLGIGFNPRGEESNIYTIEGMDACLVGTAEITLGGYHANEILEKEQLPIKMAGLSHCFRREAGAAGQYSKGLYRVHQFTKLELFVYCLPEDSERYHSLLLEMEEEIFSGLEIAYRVVDTCTGDLGAPAYRKYDIEAWMPGRGDGGEYGEVTSTSNCTDYQARSLGIRYREEDGKTRYVHMLNGTAIAMSRALVAILENYQNEDGSITIPPALVPYTGFDRIGPRT
jgi:seryl-tRNA synthetase